MHTPASFPRTARVLESREFEHVFKTGQRTATPQLALHVLAQDGPPRLGLVVSRKVDKRAVYRNRIKRVIREQFRQMRAALKSGTYVVVARPSAAHTDNARLRDALSALCLRAGTLASIPTQPSSPFPPSPLPQGGAQQIA